MNWGRLLCALGLVALCAGCRAPILADKYGNGFRDGYQAAVDSVRAESLPWRKPKTSDGRTPGEEIAHLYDVMGVRYVIATESATVHVGGPR